MNFLAHFHLAWPEEGLVAGGLEGDFYKGWLRGELPLPLEQGVRLHRAVDAYTDTHPRIAQLRASFPQPLRRYAGILIDLGFDYCLTRQWEQHSDIPLQQFTDSIYEVLARWDPALSSGSQRMARRMIEHRILDRYHQWDMVEMTARRIGQRLRHPNPMATAGEELRPLLVQFEHCFSDFYPQLLEYSQQQRLLLNQNTGVQSDSAPTPTYIEPSKR